MAERGEFELSGDFVKPFSKPLLLLVADEKLTGGQPLQRESQAQVIEHQALEFAGQELAGITHCQRRALEQPARKMRQILSTNAPVPIVLLPSIYTV